MLQPDGRAIAGAADIIRRGGLVAFPTETVYGLGAAATNPLAVERIFQVKGRPADNPLIVHVSGREQVGAVAASVSEMAEQLMNHFWPGPLSLILPRSPVVPQSVSAGLPTVAVRMPDHPAALQLINAAGVPLAAPSANRSGRPSPTTARHVLKDLAGRIDAVLDGGPCMIGVESTVLDITGSEPLILRPGAVTAAELESVLGCFVRYARWENGPPPSPGMKYRHYAPRAALILITGLPRRRERLTQSLAAYFRRRGFRVGLLDLSTSACGGDPFADAERAARYLYRALRAFDARGTEIILAQELPDQGLGVAVMNRLTKAAARIIKA
ncbi:MAG: L-threonylcarbamoyladenylate synthase [Bacillota bacterium]